MNNIALKRWLVLGGLLALTLFLAWNSPSLKSNPQSEMGLGNSSTFNVPQSTGSKFSKSGRAASIRQTSVPVSVNSHYRLAPRAQEVDEIVDLFAVPAVKRPQVDVQPVIKPATAKPQAPPLPFTFVGKIAEGDDVKIFLQADNVIYSPKVGEVFAQQYQLSRAENGKLSLIYLPLNITQTMFYGETP